MSKVRVKYQTIEFGDTDIHLKTLRDNQQFDDIGQIAEHLGVSPESWPHFGVVWESGVILARIMQTHIIQNLRVLEVGCGMGLASIVLSSRMANITATDHHPEAGAFLSSNAKLNHLEPISFVRTGWDEESLDLGKFDLIIGSDLLYDLPNIELLGQFIDQHTSAHGKVLIVDPGRGLHNKFTRKMLSLGYDHDSSLRVTAEISDSFKGRILQYSSPDTREHAATAY